MPDNIRTIRSIYVDEFQDTTEEQYRILSALSNSNHDIKYMFVGDADQTIYTGLGGVVKTKTDLEEIMPIKFLKKLLMVVIALLRILLIIIRNINNSQ